jgi:hypothetical protein
MSTDLTSYQERLQRSVATLEGAARMAGNSIRALAECEKDPDLAADIGAREGGRLHNRGEEIKNELAGLAEIAGLFMGRPFGQDLDVMVLLLAAKDNLHSEFGSIMIQGQGLTPKLEARMKMLSQAEASIDQIIKQLGGA